ncbi:phosphate--AMP phosphotransferase [bacterium]|nr:phosphate--AMP phosphotransferase [candidate division CSSED10-310 bacterium]
MLEKLDLKLKLSKKEYKALVTPLEYRLAALQRTFRERKIPLIIVFEGWKASGKSSCINRLMRAIDPRGFKVFSLDVPSREDTLRPYLWRYATKIPRAGYIAIFQRSWYKQVLADRIEGRLSQPVWSQAYDEIDAFERHLADSGHVIVKFFLHISQKEQAVRFRKMEEEPAEAWRITPESWEEHRKYDAYIEALEEMLVKTSTAEAPWTLVEAENHQFMRIKVFETLIHAMESAVEMNTIRCEREPVMGDPLDLNKYRTILMNSRSFLAKYTTRIPMDRKEYEARLAKRQKEVRELHHRMYMDRIGACLVFQGWDAAGKGGAIRRLVAPLDPRGFEVVTISAPTEIELAHHYLWRFWTRLPKAGHLTIFDRSWYGRVLVERIEGFCTRDDWQRAYQEINEFERMVSNFGMVIVKYWLHIDKDEQLLRFKDRENTPYKQWKITDEDWRNREKWEHYELAVADMIQKTSTAHAPWTVIEGNNKLFARIKIIETFIAAIRRVLDDTRPRPPLL